MRHLLLLLPLLLFGCADSSTTGSIREYNIEVAIHNNVGPVTLEFPLSVDAQSANEQTTENASDLSPDIRLQLTEGGGTGTMAGADAALKDVTSKLRNSIKEAAVERLKEQIDAGEPEEVVIPDPKPGESMNTDNPQFDPPATPEEPLAYETKFHHTQSSGPDGGKSLVLCQGQRMDFDKCVSDGVTIPRHSDGDGRETYWHMSKEPKGDIACTKDGKTYLYPASTPDDRGFVWGKC